MNKQTIITALLVSIIGLAACSSEPQWADPVAHEKTEQLQKQYGPMMVGTWHYEKIGESQRFFERNPGTEWYVHWHMVAELLGTLRW